MSRLVRSCGICGSARLSVLLDLGAQPLAERMSEDAAYPLALLRCADCSLVQLSYIVSQREMFPPGHPYASGNTAAIIAHCRELAASLTPLLSSGDLVVDIGANDGTLLRQFGGAFRRVGVEPTNQALKMSRDFLSPPAVYQDFFTAGLAERILAEHGPAKVVTACNVLAHVPDPHDFVQGVAALLGPDGVLVNENHDLRSITTGLQIDTVYHEHLRYYSVASLSRLLTMHGLEIESVTPVRAYGGSLRVLARPEGRDLQERARAAALKLQNLIISLDKPVYGIGAATRATPLILYSFIAPWIDRVCEVAGSEKIGSVMPGTSISVVDEAELIRDQPPYAILFPWQYADSLIPKLRARGYRGKFIIPLPEPRITDG